jgi:hypothetical protein
LEAFMKYRKQFLNSFVTFSLLVGFAGSASAQETKQSEGSLENPYDIYHDNNCNIIGTRVGQSTSAVVEIIGRDMAAVFHYDFTDKVDNSSQETFDSSLKNIGNEIIDDLRAIGWCAKENKEWVLHPLPAVTDPTDPLSYGHCKYIKNDPACGGRFGLYYDGRSETACADTEQKALAALQRDRGWCLQTHDKIPVTLPQKASCTVAGDHIGNSSYAELKISSSDGRAFSTGLLNVMPYNVTHAAFGTTLKSSGNAVVDVLRALNICE